MSIATILPSSLTGEGKPALSKGEGGEGERKKEGAINDSGKKI